MKAFKNVIFLSLLSLIIFSCEVNVVEPVYDIRNDYIGRYQVDEFSETFGMMTYYSWDIVKAAEVNGLWIRNFYAANIAIFAEVQGSRIFIPYQEVNGFIIEGDGWLYGPELELNYVVRDLTARHLPRDYCSTIAYR